MLNARRGPAAPVYEADQEPDATVTISGRRAGAGLVALPGLERLDVCSSSLGTVCGAPGSLFDAFAMLRKCRAWRRISCC